MEPEDLGYYLEMMRKGLRWRGIQGDPSQLGGDFVVDSEGITRLAYRSQDATDRSSVEPLLSVLGRLGGEG